MTARQPQDPERLSRADGEQPGSRLGGCGANATQASQDYGEGTGESDQRREDPGQDRPADGFHKQNPSPTGSVYRT